MAIRDDEKTDRLSRAEVAAVAALWGREKGEALPSGMNVDSLGRELGVSPEEIWRLVEVARIQLRFESRYRSADPAPPPKKERRREGPPAVLAVAGVVLALGGYAFGRMFDRPPRPARPPYFGVPATLGPAVPPGALVPPTTYPASTGPSGFFLPTTRTVPDARMPSGFTLTVTGQSVAVEVPPGHKKVAPAELPGLLFMIARHTVDLVGQVDAVARERGAGPPADPRTYFAQGYVLARLRRSDSQTAAVEYVPIAPPPGPNSPITPEMVSKESKQLLSRLVERAMK